MVLGSECWRGRLASEEQWEATGKSVKMEKVSEVERGLMVVGFVGEEQDFELDMVWDTELLELRRTGIM